MKERILQFISYLGISNKEFETNCGMSNGYINSMRKGLGTSKIENVLKAYPQLNRNWLVNGEGEMLCDKTTEDDPQSKDFDKLQELRKEMADLIAERDKLKASNANKDDLINVLTRALDLAQKANDARIETREAKENK